MPEIKPRMVIGSALATGVIAGVAMCGAQHRAEEAGDDQATLPPVESETGSQAQNQNEAPSPQLPAASDTRFVNAFLDFFLEDGRYPQTDAITVEVPPNGPEEIVSVIEAIQQTNQAAAPDVEPSIVDAVTSCGGAVEWRRGGNWQEVLEHMQAGRFGEADIACQAIARSMASAQPDSGTSYFHVPVFTQS